MVIRAAILLLVPGSAGLAAVASESTDPVGGLVQYGALGIVAASAIGACAWFVRTMRDGHEAVIARMMEEHQAVVAREQARTDSALADAKATRDAWAAEVREIHRNQNEKVLPALLASADMAKEAMHLIRDGRGAR